MLTRGRYIVLQTLWQASEARGHRGCVMMSQAWGRKLLLGVAQRSRPAQEMVRGLKGKGPGALPLRLLPPHQIHGRIRSQVRLVTLGNFEAFIESHCVGRVP